MIEQEIITKVIEQQSTEVQLDKEISEDYYDGEYYNVCVDCGKLVEDCYGTNCSKSKEIKEYKINISSVLSSVFNGEIINCIEKDSDGFTYELQNHFLVTIPLNQSPKERLEHIFRKGKIHLILNSDIELNSTFCFPIRVKQVSKNIQTLENIHKSR